MSEYDLIEIIFQDIEIFIIDYVRFFQMIIDYKHGNIFSIRLENEEFYFPATLTEFSHRTKQLQYRLQRQIRSLAQKRRNEISRGINIHKDYSKQNQHIRFHSEFKKHLENFKIHTQINRIYIIIDSLELYDEIQFESNSLNNTFRLLPILQYIHKQLYCIKNYLEKILNHHTLIIERHFKKLQEKLHSYDNNMRDKLLKFHSRDIRPPVLIIPCPTNTSQLTSSKSFNALIIDKLKQKSNTRPYVRLLNKTLLQKHPVNN